MPTVSGSLTRCGSTKRRTPNVEKSTDSSYRGGCAKFKQKASNNFQYSTGAHRLENDYSEELKNYDQLYKKNQQRCDWIAERANIKRSEPVLLNSFHKFNTEKGYDKVEWNAIHQEEVYWKKITRNGSFRSQSKNHKKWHRNHPTDGFYQKRTIDADDLEDEDKVIEYSHLYEE